MEEMENKNDIEQPLDPELAQALEEETPKYVPRPAWQVWGARIALVLFILMILLYYLKIARGGL